MITAFHHVGCLVANIQEAIADYSILYPAGEVSQVYDIDDQKVKVCFFSICGMRVEFVEPTDTGSSLYRSLQKNGSFYHIGIYTDDIDAETDRLEQSGYRKVTQFRSAAFNDNYCAFLLNNEMHLIELIEMKNE